MLANLSVLSEASQAALSQEALRHAAMAIASQAESLAADMEQGALNDRGGADALRLLTAIIRLNGQEMAGLRDMAVAGRA